ncbi:MAG: hypothetical protein UV05_C0052G0006 [candidate division CPR1 bacterium GW2011_GWA2_42_17]|uniref:Phosphoribosyltransferase domain-containing protein n=2 Tax=Bacteria candidate phyla TaxID=1783234 RepID=A0A0G1BW49_9BACT|nr:MAG: hypothetical protein UV05_C0052G0006 [candidate division CPR1 bacterium GW2011_GWA2_42_17]
MMKEPVPSKQEREFNYEIFSSPEDREFLRHIADRFIQKARPNGYDAMLYLDMGARIFNHLIKARWKFLHPEEKVPDTRFINIGREKARGTYEHPHVKFRERDIPEFAEGARKVFDWDKGQYKKVIIVDEFVDSGGTLSFAQKVMQAAFPNITFDNAALALMSDEQLDNESITIRPEQEERKKMEHIVFGILNRGDRGSEVLPNVHDLDSDALLIKKYGADMLEDDWAKKQNKSYRQAVQELVALAGSEQ